MATFHAIRDEAIRAVDAVMSERVRHLPLTGGVRDATRPQVEFEAVLRVGNAKDRDAAGTNTWGQRVSYGKAEMHIARGVAPAIRKGDKLRAVERDRQPFFEVLSVNERQHGRVVVELGEST